MNWNTSFYLITNLKYNKEWNIFNEYVYVTEDSVVPVVELFFTYLN